MPPTRWPSWASSPGGRQGHLGKGAAAVFDVDRIDEIERETKHDVIAFLTHVTEIVRSEARFLHQGMTSSHVNDTALAVQLGRSTDLLLEGVDLVLKAIKRRRWSAS